MAALREVLAFFGVEVETEQLEKGDGLVDQFKDTLLGFGKAVVAAFAVDAVIDFGKELIDQADELREAAIALGTVPQELQKLEFAAGTAGVEVGALRATLQKFNRTAAQVAEGKGPSEAFKRLGIEVKNQDGTIKGSAQLFEEVGAAIAQIENPIERAGLAQEAFGRSYAKLLPLFAEGPEGLAKLKQEAVELGMVFDDAFLTGADDFNDNITKLKGGLQGLMLQVLGPLLPDLVSISQSMVRATKAGLAWLKGTRLLQAVLTGFSIKGVMALATAIPALILKMGGWRLAFATLGRFILRTLLPLIALEDIIGFLAGDDSSLGAFLDRQFGKGTQEKVRAFFSLVANLFGAFVENSGAAYDTLADDNAHWLKRTLAGFALLLSDTRRFFAAIANGWSTILVEMGIAIDEFALRVFNAWNSMLAGLQLPSFVYTALKIDTKKAEQELAGFKAQQDALQRDAYERATGTGKHEPAGTKAHREQNTGVEFYRKDGADLTDTQQALAEMFKQMRFGGGPGAGPYRIDDAGAPAYPTAATAAVPQSVVHDNHVDVGGVRVQQNITVPPGTTEEQARDLGRGAAGGVKEAVNTRAIEAALVHTGG
jgi:hypothetical protein